MLQTIHIVVSGKVQGVFFRHYTREKALQLDITGNVRNTDDGRVEIIATGTPEQLSALTAFCKQGPPRAAVTAVQSEKIPLQHFTSFEIARP
jgi:acylphosphatase